MLTDEERRFITMYRAIRAEERNDQGRSDGWKIMNIGRFNPRQRNDVFPQTSNVVGNQLVWDDVEMFISAITQHATTDMRIDVIKRDFGSLLLGTAAS